MQKCVCFLIDCRLEYVFQIQTFSLDVCARADHILVNKHTRVQGSLLDIRFIRIHFYISCLVRGIIYVLILLLISLCLICVGEFKCY
ncbi:hypothetical protein Hanom_Chr03g00236901 [Helianthus anomalus]